MLLISNRVCCQTKMWSEEKKGRRTDFGREIYRFYQSTYKNPPFLKGFSNYL